MAADIEYACMQGHHIFHAPYAADVIAQTYARTYILTRVQSLGYLWKNTFEKHETDSVRNPESISF